MKDLVKWKVNGIFKADANKCYAEMLDLENITPQAVLERAKDENSELHKCFEWDNDVAAEKYRTIQAGNVIRMLYIEPKGEDAPPVRVLSRTSDTVYQPTRTFLTNATEYEDLLKRALSELESFRKKYETLSELEQVFEQIDLINAQIIYSTKQKITGRVKKAKTKQPIFKCLIGGIATIIYKDSLKHDNTGKDMKAQDTTMQYLCDYVTC